MVCRNMNIRISYCECIERLLDQGVASYIEFSKISRARKVDTIGYSLYSSMVREMC